MNAGGAETFLMKIYRNIDRNKYQFDFCVNTEQNYYQNEIREMGGRIYVIPAKSESIVKYIVSLKSLIKNNEYKYVIRVNEHSLSVIDLLIAKSGGAEKLIMRSSNADSAGLVTRLLHKMFKFLPMHVPDVKIAPSKKSAEYTFGKSLVKRDKVVILHNGLDVSKFNFSEDIRNKYRNNLEINDEIVVGHIGRFFEQKNHMFLIDVFNEILKIEPNAVLLLIGEGELKNSVLEKVNKLGISRNVRFLGLRSDVNNLLMAMDVFLFPSLFEGMPNTVIEAQATGLPCLISDSITDEANITGRVTYYSLKRSSKEWAEKCLFIAQSNESRNIGSIFFENGYDIQSVTKKFQDIVFN